MGPPYHERPRQQFYTEGESGLG